MSTSFDRKLRAYREAESNSTSPGSSVGNGGDDGATGMSSLSGEGGEKVFDSSSGPAPEPVGPRPLRGNEDKREYGATSTASPGNVTGTRSAIFFFFFVIQC